MTYDKLGYRMALIRVRSMEVEEWEKKVSERKYIYIKFSGYQWMGSGKLIAHFMRVHIKECQHVRVGQFCPWTKPFATFLLCCHGCLGQNYPPSVWCISVTIAASSSTRISWQEWDGKGQCCVLPLLTSK